MHTVTTQKVPLAVYVRKAIGEIHMKNVNVSMKFAGWEIVTLLTVNSIINAYKFELNVRNS